jgi:hypothetical protein
LGAPKALRVEGAAPQKMAGTRQAVDRSTRCLEIFVGAGIRNEIEIAQGLRDSPIGHEHRTVQARLQPHRDASYVLQFNLLVSTGAT